MSWSNLGEPHEEELSPNLLVEIWRTDGLPRWLGLGEADCSKWSAAHTASSTHMIGCCSPEHHTVPVCLFLYPLNISSLQKQLKRCAAVSVQSNKLKGAAVG